MVRSTWPPVSPMPRAASRTSGSTSRIPTYVLVRIGGMANTVNAIHDARKPFHLREIEGWMARRVRSDRVGTARNALAALTATCPPRPVWPSTTPTPPPSAIAETTTAADSTSWCQNRRRIPSGPHQLLDVVNQPKTWATKLIPCLRSLPRPAVTGPRDGESLGTDEQQVRNRGQRDRQDQPDDDRGVVPDVEAIGDLLPEPPEADQRGDGHQTDDGCGGDTQPGEDEGQGERKIDADQRRGLRIAERGGRLARIGRYSIEPGHRVPDHDQQRVADKRDLRRLVGRHKAGNGTENREQGERRDDVERAGESEDRRTHEPIPPGQHGQRDRNGGADGDRDDAELD